jgi:hypothetical protein
MRFIVVTSSTGSRPSYLPESPAVPIKWQRGTAHFLTPFGCNHFVSGQSIFIAGIAFRSGTTEPYCSCQPCIGIFGTGRRKSVTPDLVHKRMAQMPGSGKNRIRTPHSKRQESPVCHIVEQLVHSRAYGKTDGRPFEADDCVVRLVVGQSVQGSSSRHLSEDSS